MKKIISVLLTLSLLGGILGLVAVAAEPTLEITSQNPAYNETIPTENLVTVNDPQKYTVQARWGVESPSGLVNATGKFGYGIYYLEVTVTFAAVDDPTYIYVDGINIWESGQWSLMDRDAGRIQLMRMFEIVPANGYINFVPLKGAPAELEAGKAAPATAVTTQATSFSIESQRWENEDGSALTANPQNGKVYYLAIKMKPAEGYAFAQHVDCEMQLPEDWVYDYVESAADGTLTYRVRYSLLPRVEQMSISYTKPAAGSAVFAPADLVLPQGAKYRVELVEVYDSEGNPATHFADGKAYFVEAVFAIADGYEWDVDKISLNGKEHYDYYQPSEENLCVSFRVSYLQAIERVEINFTVPTVGATASEITVPSGVHYSKDYAGWNGTDQPFNGSFVKDRYDLFVNLMAETGYEFTEDTAAYINGALVDEGDVYLTWAQDGIEIHYAISLRDKISSVALPAFPDAKVGDTAAARTPVQLPATAEHYQADINWIYCKDFEEAGLFVGVMENNNTYYCQYELICEPGYEFAENVTVTVGGTPFRGSMLFDDTTGYVMKQFSFGLQLIDRIELTISNPYVGLKPDEIVLPQNAPFTVEDVQWAVAEENELFSAELMGKDEAFEQGLYYFASLTVKPKAGYAFADTYTIVVNGVSHNMDLSASALDNMPLSTVLAKGGMMVLSAGVGVPAPAPTPTPTPVPTGDSGMIELFVALTFLSLVGLVVVFGKKHSA